MTAAGKLWESGRLAIVQGVGYPNPSRSHFKSMAIWQSANVDLPRGGDEDDQTRAALGWLGRALDGRSRPADGAPDAAFVGKESLPLALRGRRSVAMDLSRPEELTLAGRADPKKAASRSNARSSSPSASGRWPWRAAKETARGEGLGAREATSALMAVVHGLRLARPGAFRSTTSPRLFDRLSCQPKKS